MEILNGSARPLSHSSGSFFLVLILVTPLLSAQTVDEYEVKAAFLYNLTKFVEWPRNDSDSFNVCILGDDPFGFTLNQIVKGKVANGKKLQVRRLRNVAEAKQCQIVYVRAEETTKAAQVIETLKSLPVLTVGEQAAFGKMGGMVCLTMMDDHVNISINSANAESYGLKISAKLLSLAKPPGER